MPVPDRPPVKRRLVLAYSAGQIIEIMMLGVVATFLLIYLTSVCGLRPGVAGLVLFISLAVDAVLDPLIGAVSDGWKSPWGRRHPFMIVGIVVLPIAIVGVFILPTGLPASWVFGYVLAFNIMMRVSTSFFILPFAALLPELSRDYAERARIMIYRLTLAVVAWAATLVFAFEVIFRGEDSLSLASSYVPFAFLLAGIVLVSGFVSTFGTLSAAKAVRRPPEKHPPLSRFITEVIRLFRNPSFVSLFFGATIFMTASGFLTSVNIHVLRYYWGLAPEQMQLPTVAQPVGMMISVPLSIWLVKTVEKRTIMFVAIFGFAITYSVLPFLKDIGASATNPLIPLLLVTAGSLVFGAGSGFSFIASGSMVADATDEHDLLFGIRREGLFFASLVLGAKCALGLGGLLAGLGLQLIGFPSDPASPAGAAQLSPQVIERLGLLWGPGFAFCILCAAPFFFAYRLDGAAHVRILREIDRRHGN